MPRGYQSGSLNIWRHQKIALPPVLYCSIGGYPEDNREEIAFSKVFPENGYESEPPPAISMRRRDSALTINGVKLVWDRTLIDEDAGHSARRSSA